MVTIYESPDSSPIGSLDVRPFDGSSAEAAAFVNAVWSAQFPDNFSCPQWDEDYFAWRQFGQDRHIRVAAYLDDRLVGYVFGEEIPMLWQDRPTRAMFSTTLAVDPALKGMGIAKQLSANLRATFDARNLSFMYGFAVPGQASLGPKFWTRIHGASRAPGIRPFVRPVNARLLAGAAGSAGERGMASLARWARLDHRPNLYGSSVRAYRPDDLDTCLSLLRRAETGADLRFDWTRSWLEHTLDFGGTPRTLVFDQGDGPIGFLTYHRTWFRGRKRFGAAVIDHAVSPDKSALDSLISAALNRMADDEVALAICPTSASAPVTSLLKRGFVPLPNRYDVLFPFRSVDHDSGALRRVAVHLA